MSNFDYTNTAQTDGQTLKKVGILFAYSESEVTISLQYLRTKNKTKNKPTLCISIK